MNCLPYAMVMGGFHCGSASLWSAVYKHPMVVKTDVSRWHFWAEFDKTMSGYLGGMSRATAHVLAWPGLTAAGQEAVKADVTAAADVGPGSMRWMGGQQKILLDGSSSTFSFYWSPNVRAHRAFVASMVPCWNGCSTEHREGPGRDSCLEKCFPAAREADRKVVASLGLQYNDVSLPLLISAVYGKRPPKMIVLMRNPVDRLYSAYWRYGHYRDKFGANPDGFTTYAREQLSSLKECMARNDTDDELSCLLHFETWGLSEERLYFHADQLLRGVYSVWMETWLKFFDRRDLLLLRSEDYFAEPLKTFDKVLAFLDLDPAAIAHHARISRLTKASSSTKLQDVLKPLEDDKLWDDIRRTLLEGEEEGRYATNRAAAQGTPGTDSRPAMAADIRQELAAFYGPYNKRLAELLGDPEFIRGWD